MKIGIMLPQEWEQNQIDPIEAYETMTHIAQEAETLGFASIWLFDHLQSAASSQPAERLIFECWTSTAALARDTSRIRIGQAVTCNSFRNPALLAKMASTVDVLSHGRLELGLGAGWHETEYLAYGYPFHDPATRLRQLREAIQVINVMWTEENAYFEGQQYQLRGAINQPKGVQYPHIPLLIGGKGEHVTLKLVARYGDACNFTHPTSRELAHKFALIERYCAEIGRNELDIRRTIYVNGFIARTDVQAEAKAVSVPGKFSLDDLHARGLLGSPDTIRRRLHALEQQGVQEVIVSLHDISHGESLRLLAQAMS